MPALRIGVLGAARIVPAALLTPARSIDDVEITALAARDPARAQAFAKRHGIPRVFRSYAELLADPDVDAIFNPLPNSLHCEWSIRALEAGKHVLCEKPLAATALEAEQMVTAAARAGRVLMEAMHYRHHPLAARMIALARGGALGRVLRIETSVCVPPPLPGDIRYQRALAGGALLDVGVYAVHMLRHLAGAEPAIVRPEVRFASSGVDRFVCAEALFADGRTGRVRCSLLSPVFFDVSARVVGDRGELRVCNPLLPHRYHRLAIRAYGETRVERWPGSTSYEHQLRHFVRSVRVGEPVLTSADDALRTMRVIDGIRDHCGFPFGQRRESGTAA